jgi:hypothetical protein
MMVTDSGFDEDLILGIKARAKSFASMCEIREFEHRLTPNSETSPYTICFGIFLLHFLGAHNNWNNSGPILKSLVVTGLREYALSRRRELVNLHMDKQFMQLMSFSLSALYLLDGLDENPLDDIVEALIPQDMNIYLEQVGAFEGRPTSGNLAMCMASLMIYARDYLNRPCEKRIDDWIEGHLKNMNGNGFWGPENTLSHLQFQNGYHQYEILEYLNISNPKIDKAAAYIHQIADTRSQFAPYFGGSGCYDYDAVAILTAKGYLLKEEDKKLLRLTAQTIMSEQNEDGGFSETQWIRPRTAKNLYYWMRHILTAKGALKYERAKCFLSFIRPKYDRLPTHWTIYSRQWNESNLWDTWFRLMLLARIDCKFNSVNKRRWGFIEFPGIGFHSKG